MKTIDIVMPQMGESIMECTVLSLLKKEGDWVEVDDSLMEVATDKVDTEVPSAHSGKIVKWLVETDQVIQIGMPIAQLELSDQNLTVAIEPEPPTTEKGAATQLEEELDKISSGLREGNTVRSSNVASENNNGFFSPLVLSISRQEGIPEDELSRVRGTGLDKRVTKADILTYLQQRSAGTIPTSPKPASSLSGEIEIIEMDRMRKMIAQRMVESKQISPHVTSFVETDMTPVVNWRNRIKDSYRAKYHEGITFTPILIEAVVKAIKQFPRINISVDGDRILVKKDINIGMAVALPDGNLIVPVIHRADQYDLAGLSRKVNELASKARQNKLKADDLAGGTYTISNIGSFGNLMGTPIIVQPQVAIMAFGAIQKKPAVIETTEGDLIGIRSMMFISHSYDHRVVDGSLGGQFVKRVSDHLEQFDITQNP